MVGRALSKVARMGGTASTVFGLALVIALMLPTRMRGVQASADGLRRWVAARVYGIGLPSVERQRWVRRSRRAPRALIFSARVDG